MSTTSKQLLFRLHRNRSVFLALIVLICGGALVWNMHRTIVAPHTIRIATDHIETLRSHNHDEETDQVSDTGHAEYMTGSATTTEDLWVTDIHFRVHNAPLSVVHHAGIYSDKVTLDTTCPGGALSTIYSLVGSDSPIDWSFPKPYGIFIPKGTTIRNLSMLHSALPPVGRGGTYHDVYTEYELTVLPNDAGRTRPVIAVSLSLRDQAYCYEDVGGPTFTVPAHTEDYVRTPGTTTPNRGRYTFSEPARIIGANGHTHSWEGGGPVEFLLNNKILRTYVPKRDEQDGRLWLTPPTPISQYVYKGDTVSVIAHYSNPGTEPVLGAMGIVLMYFSPE